MSCGVVKFAEHWTKIWFNALSHFEPKCFVASEGQATIGARGGSTTVIHFFLNMSVCGNRSEQCEIRIDDAWDGAMVHTLPAWPDPRDGYTDFSFHHSHGLYDPDKSTSIEGDIVFWRPKSYTNWKRGCSPKSFREIINEAIGRIDNRE